MSRPTEVAKATSTGGGTAQIQTTCAAAGAVRSRLMNITVTGYASLALAFCLATRRCMNFAPSFLYA
jgi:hypothetical protein